MRFKGDASDEAAADTVPASKNVAGTNDRQENLEKEDNEEDEETIAEGPGNEPSKQKKKKKKSQKKAVASG